MISILVTVSVVTTNFNPGFSSSSYTLRTYGDAVQFIKKKIKSLNGKFKGKKLICFNIKTVFRLKKEKINSYYI